MSVGRTITRNTAFNAIGRCWEAVSSLVLLGYVVPKVGYSAMGMWFLVSSFTGYVALFDIGLGSSFVKYIAGHAARDELDEISAVVSTGFYFYAVFGALLVAIGWPCIDSAVALLGRLKPETFRNLTDPRFLGDLRFLLRWGLVLFAASLSVQALSSLQGGLQRMGVTNALGFAVSLVKIAATVFFLETGHGVRGLLYANGLSFAVFALASAIIAFVLVPGLRVTPARMHWATLGRLYSFGWRAQVSRAAHLVSFETDRIIVLGRVLEYGPVAMYDVGVTLANKARQIPSLMLGAVLPAASSLDAREDHERLRQLYVLASKYVAAASVPLFAFLIALAAPLLRLWMGEATGFSVWVLRIIAAGYIPNVLAGAGVVVALGRGRADLQMKAGLLSTVSNIALTIILVTWIGLIGVPLGTALSMLISWAWFSRAVRPIAGMGAMACLRAAVLWPALAALPGFVLCATAGLAFDGVEGRLYNGVIVLVCGTVFAALYFLLIRLTPFLNVFDVHFLEENLHLGRLPGFRWWTRRARHA